MFGWHETSGKIYLPIRTFAQSGWAYPVFRHEATHWFLGISTPYGIAERELALFGLMTQVFSEKDLNNSFIKLVSAMHNCSFIAHEGLATYVGIQVASESDINDLSAQMLSKLDQAYKSAFLLFFNLVEELHLPLKSRIPIALFIDLMAFGSDILDRWSHRINNLQSLEDSLYQHGPDSRLISLLQKVKGLSKPVLQEWIDSYECGKRPQLVDELKELSITILDPEDIWTRAFQFHDAFSRAIRPVFLQAKVGSKVFEEICKSIEAILHLMEKGGSDPLWHVTLTPDRYKSQPSTGDFPASGWLRSRVFYIMANDTPIPNIAYSRSSLAGELIQSGEFFIQAHFDNRLTTQTMRSNDIDLLQRRFRSLRKDQYVFVWSGCYDFEHFDVRGFSLLTGRPHYVVHLGDFAELEVGWLRKCVRRGEKLQVFLLASRMAERVASSMKPVTAPQVGAFGYVLFKSEVSGAPIVVWPTPMFVAEHILNDKEVCSHFGFTILDSLNIPLSFSFFEPFELFTGIMCFRDHFEPPLGNE